MDKKKNSDDSLIYNIIEAIENIKGKEINILDLRELENTVCDYFIICEGSSNTQVNAIVASIQKHVSKELKDKPWNIEGATFVDRKTKILEEGFVPAIHDFTMERDGKDFTSILLEEENLIVVVVYSVSNSELDGFKNIKEATDKAIKNNYKVIGLSSSSPEVTEELKRQNDLNFDFYFCDETALKTVVRSNPSLIKLHKGTIRQKLHWNDSSRLIFTNNN